MMVRSRVYRIRDWDNDEESNQGYSMEELVVANVAWRVSYGWECLKSQGDGDNGAPIDL